MVSALDIDLPVIRPPSGEAFPFCDVAEYLPAYGLPNLPGVTFVYAHARAGMFLSLLTASRVEDGSGMLGVTVDLYASDAYRHRYAITEVHRHLRSLDVVNEIAGNALVLQTSETPSDTGTKLVVIARPIGQPTRTSTAAARPVARPRDCRG